MASASREYFRVDDNEDRQKVKNLLEEYCGLDTLGMADMEETDTKNASLSGTRPKYLGPL